MKLINGWYLPDEEKHLVKYIEKDGMYQAKHRKHALSFVKNFDFALDVGAHIGLWAKELSEKFTKIIAFEPMPEYRICLLENVKKVEVLPFALGAYNGTINMIKTPGATGHTYCSLFPGYEVEMRALDSFSLTHVDFIKIDAEGFESEILEGAAGLLLRDKPIVNIEQKAHEYSVDHLLGCKVLEKYGATLLSKYADEYVYGWI